MPEEAAPWQPRLQVILQHDVDKVGKSGELVKVRPGFARNFLIPRGLAVPATTAAVNRITHEKAVAVAKAEKTKKEMPATSPTKINGLKLTHRAPGRRGRPLFGSVTVEGHRERGRRPRASTIDRKKMHLAEPLKALGTFEIPVSLLTDVTATIKVEVVKK